MFWTISYYHSKQNLAISVVSEVLESAEMPLSKSCGMNDENFDALHPDGEKSQILSILTAYMHPTLSQPCEEELAFLILAGRTT